MLFFILKFFLNILLKNSFKVKLLKKRNYLKKFSFNKLKLNLLINLILIKFINKFNFNLLKIYLRNLNIKLLKFINRKNNLIDYKYLFNISKIFLLFFYSIIFKNSKLIFNFIFYLFSSWIKNHFKIFKIICDILLLLFNSSLVNIIGLRLKIKGKINGNMRKKKLDYYLGRLVFSRFDNSMDYNFLTKLTVFGSIGFKFWIIYD